MHTYWCMCVFDYVCGIFVRHCHSPAVEGKTPLPPKEAAHNYKFHSEKHKEKAAVDGPIEKMPIYSELLDILKQTVSFVFVMEHVDEGNCHVITPC